MASRSTPRARRSISKRPKCGHADRPGRQKNVLFFRPGIELMGARTLLATMIGTNAGNGGRLGYRWQLDQFRVIDRPSRADHIGCRPDQRQRDHGHTQLERDRLGQQRDRRDRDDAEHRERLPGDRHGIDHLARLDDQRGDALPGEYLDSLRSHDLDRRHNLGGCHDAKQLRRNRLTRGSGSPGKQTVFREYAALRWPMKRTRGGPISPGKRAVPCNKARIHALRLQEQ
jgi:hypothetical protein